MNGTKVSMDDSEAFGMFETRGMNRCLESSIGL